MKGHKSEENGRKEGDCLSMFKTFKTRLRMNQAEIKDETLQRDKDTDTQPWGQIHIRW